MTTNTDIPAPIALQTAPSGKVTKWGIPGSDETFKTKGAAQAALDAQPGIVLTINPSGVQAIADATGESVEQVREAITESNGADVAAARRAEAYAKAREEEAEKAAPKPKAEPKPPVDELKLIKTVLVSGVTVDERKKSGFRRMVAHEKPLGYVKASRNGVALEVLASRLKDAPAAMLSGTVAFQNQIKLKVNDEATTKQAQELLAYAAHSVKP